MILSKTVMAGKKFMKILHGGVKNVPERHRREKGAGTEEQRQKLLFTNSVAPA